MSAAMKSRDFDLATLTVVGCRDLAYDASVTSGDPGSMGVPDAGPSACATLTLCSPLTGFQYTVDSTAYTCTLERQIEGQCTDGLEATVCVGRSTPSSVQVTVENLEEAPILAYVQGGLASGKDVTYDTPEVDCGTADVIRSGASNVVTWWDGTLTRKEVPTSDSHGFPMAPAERCMLTVPVTKTFGSPGEQPLTGSWSMVATFTDGSQQQSNYTGRLAVNVVSCP